LLGLVIVTVCMFIKLYIRLIQNYSTQEDTLMAAFNYW